ncbi:type II secretion system pilot lipoprotein GspS-beta [Vibrio campbellii]|uniref:type II secretion system pilot lipoprotein GspS-beta n=1 Tax=Vibrio campbellii TaxID=680 RepID=UPI00142E5084
MRIILSIILLFACTTGCTNHTHQYYIVTEIAKNRANMIKLHTPKPIRWGTITDAYNDNNTIVVIIDSSEEDYINILNSRKEIIRRICSDQDVVNITERGVSYRFIVNHSRKKTIFSLKKC